MAFRHRAALCVGGGRPSLKPRRSEAVRALTKKGVPQACVSNSGRAVVDANLDALGIRDAIAFSISLNDVSKGKPDPEPFREAARRFGLPPASVVAVEDSAAGARSAREAGLYVVGYVPSGATLDCDLLIPKLPELLTLFD